MRRRIQSLMAAGLLAVFVCALGPADLAAQEFVNKQKITKAGFSRGPLVEFLQAIRNQAMASGVITFGTTAAKARTTATVPFRIDGTLYSLASTDDLCTMPTTTSTVTQTFLIRLELNTAGTCTATAGAVVTTAGGLALLPPRTASRTTIGHVKVSNYSGGFTGATSSLNNAAVTFVNGDMDLGPDALVTN